MSRGKYGDAVNQLHRLIVAWRTAAKRDKYLPMAYYKLAQCYQDTGRHYEAAYLYEYVLYDCAG